MQAAYGETQVTIMKAATTWWLYHGLVDRYASVLDSLDAIYHKNKEPEATGIRSNLTNKNTVSMVLLLCDVLKLVNIIMQDASVNFLDVDANVKMCIDSLHGIIHGPESEPLLEIFVFLNFRTILLGLMIALI